MMLTSPPVGIRPTPPRAWVWGFARAAVKTFYRVERLGAELPSGALLLIANHPNTLFDPALIQATAGRRIRFLAKSTLFRNHPLSLFVRNSGAIPVYRRIDAGVDTSRNVEMFAAVEAVLADGEAICLFPEGISHDRGRLEPLRTGAARIALKNTAMGYPVTIVPVGLNFEHLPAFRSRVTAVFGRAFGCSDLVDTYTADEPRAVRALTDRMSERLRHLLIEANPRHDLPIVERIDRLYASARGVSRDARDRVRRRRLIADGMEHLRQHDPERLDEILLRVRAYDASLERFGLRDRDVDQRIPFALARRFVVREGLLALLLAPVAVASLCVFGVPYWITGQISRWAPDLQSRATWQVMGGVATYGVWIGLLSAAIGLWLGATAAAIAAGGLILFAFVGLVAFEREAAVVRTVRSFLALRQTPLRARAQVKRQRAALAAVLEQVRDWIDQGPGTGDQGSGIG